MKMSWIRNDWSVKYVRRVKITLEEFNHESVRMWSSSGGSFQACDHTLQPRSREGGFNLWRHWWLITWPHRRGTDKARAHTHTYTHTPKKTLVTPDSVRSGQIMQNAPQAETKKKILIEFVHWKLKKSGLYEFMTV